MRLVLGFVPLGPLAGLTRVCRALGDLVRECWLWVPLSEPSGQDGPPAGLRSLVLDLRSRGGETVLPDALFAFFRRGRLASVEALRLTVEPPLLHPDDGPVLEFLLSAVVPRGGLRVLDATLLKDEVASWMAVNGVLRANAASLRRVVLRGAGHLDSLRRTEFVRALAGCGGLEHLAVGPSVLNGTDGGGGLPDSVDLELFEGCVAQVSADVWRRLLAGPRLQRLRLYVTVDATPWWGRLQWPGTPGRLRELSVKLCYRGGCGEKWPVRGSLARTGPPSPTPPYQR